MNIGIITYHRAINFGAVLQAFALSLYLRKCGHTVTIIDYHRDGDNNSVLNKRHKLHVAIQLLKTNPIYAVLYMVERVLLTLNKKALKQKKNIQRKKKVFADKFASFRELHFKLTEHEYLVPYELKINPPNFDAYIAGSDQIWGPGPTGLSDAYYLNFGEPGRIRIAYAASFGVSSIKRIWYRSLKQHLACFNAISVREHSGLNILKKVGVNAVQVLDPTLLIDDYSAIIRKPQIKKFLFVYRLHQTKELEEKFNAFIDHVLMLRKLNIVTCATMSSYPQYNDTIMGVEDFLGHIACAEMVVTNSFHGTAFCILFKKPFFCFGRVEEQKGQNDRMLDLLRQLNLLNRFIHGDDTDVVTRLSDEAIDWGDVHERLNMLRRHSFDYLEKYLQQ